jgi:hypothetical protein
LRHSETKKRLEQLERDRDQLLGSLEDAAAEALDSLSPEDRQQLYKMLRLKVAAKQDGSMEVSGAFDDSLSVCDLDTAHRCNTQNTKRPELHFHVVLGHGDRELRFERVMG